MRRWIWIATLAGGVACIGGYAYFLTDSAVPIRYEEPRPAIGAKPFPKEDGDAELSEPIEPIVVDRGPTGRGQPVEPPRGDEPLPRVAITPDTPQSPRPDAEPGRTPARMPYADEERFFPIPLDPITRIQQSTLPPLQLPEEPRD